METPASHDYDVYLTLREMFCVRGYGSLDRLLSPQEFQTCRQETDNILSAEHRAYTRGPGEHRNARVVVFFPASAKLGVRKIRQYIKKLQTLEARHAILVTNCTITHFARTEIENEAPVVIFETFLAEQLRVNITKHRIVVPHIPVPQGDVDELLLRLRATREQLPKLYNTDPIARFYAFPVGSVIKVGPRKLGSLTPHYGYRLVVAG